MSGQERAPIWMETPVDLGYVRAVDHAVLKAREERLRRALEKITRHAYANSHYMVAREIEVIAREALTDE